MLWLGRGFHGLHPQFQEKHLLLSLSLLQPLLLEQINRLSGSVLVCHTYDRWHPLQGIIGSRGQACCLIDSRLFFPARGRPRAVAPPLCLGTCGALLLLGVPLWTAPTGVSGFLGSSPLTTDCCCLTASASPAFATAFSSVNVSFNCSFSNREASLSPTTGLSLIILSCR